MMSWRRLFIARNSSIILANSKVLEIATSLKACFHNSPILDAHQRSKAIGNPAKKPFMVARECVPVWKVHWLYLMKRKAELDGEEEPRPRCDQLNWNYDAELSAFAHRLKIEVYSDTIKAVFMEPSQDSPRNSPNERLFNAGLQFSTAFIKMYITRAFPRVGKDCADSITRYLTSENLTSYLADNLGYRDLIQSADFPIHPHSLYRCFFASVAAILAGPGGRLETARFVYDFVISDLVAKDIVHDIWRPKDPMKELEKELLARDRPLPEVRLTRQCGINTIQPTFFIGIFCEKQLLVESAGESVIKAEVDAAKLALKQLYGVDIGSYLPLVDVFAESDFCKQIEQIPFDEFILHNEVHEQETVHDSANLVG